MDRWEQHLGAFFGFNYFVVSTLLCPISLLGLLLSVSTEFYALSRSKQDKKQVYRTPN